MPTPEERAARAMIDSPYRTPQVRIAREIHEALDEAKTGFRETLEQLAVVVAQARAIEQTQDAQQATGAATHDLLEQLARELDQARQALR